MKTTKLGLVFAGFLAVIVAGCAAFGSNPTPPTALEHALFDVVTNTVTMTNNVQVTNMVQQLQVTSITVTNTNNVIQTILLTNTIPVTNVVTILQTTNEQAYTLTEKAGTATGINTVGTGLNVFFPGVGTIAGLGLTALTGLWGYLRSSKLGNTSTALAQEIETIREFIQALPNGNAYDSAITSFLAAHQTDAGTITTVLNLLTNEVSNPDAKVAAQQIINTINALAPATPTPPPAPISAVKLST